MANLTKISSTQNSITIQVVGLQYADSLYDFRFSINGGGTTTWSTSNKTYSSLQCGTTYSFTGGARYPKTTGTWYDFSGSYTTNACPPSNPNTPSGSATAGNGTVVVTATFDGTATAVDAYIVPTNKWINSSGGSVSFTGLTNGTSYTPYIRSYNSGTGLYSSYIALNSVTPTGPVPPRVPSMSHSTTASTITVSATFTSTTHHVNVYIPGGKDINGNTNQTQSIFTSGNSVTFYGFAESTTYTVSYQAWDSTETLGSGSNSFSATTATVVHVYPSPPSWTTTSTVNSISTHLTVGANTSRIEANLPQATVPLQILYQGPQGTTGTLTHTGLQPKTEYTIYLQVFSSTGDSISNSYNFRTAGARPINFDGWTTTVASGQPCTLKASDWNQFTSKINEFRVYKKVANPNYGFTSVQSGWAYSAWIFNQAVTAMAGLGVTVPLARTGGQVQAIEASWINSLVTALNSVV